MISVIAPNLNEEKHLPTFLNSLLHQTFTDFELVLVDGGSTNGSYTILSRYYGIFQRRNIRFTIIKDTTRNFGYIRNLGAKHAQGDIMLHCNTDNYLEPKLLEKLEAIFRDRPETLAVAGRVYPLGTSLTAHLGYQIFDFLRFIFTCAPMPVKKYRPSGNFLSIRSKIFRRIGGHPEVRANEDGLLGQKLDAYAARNHKAVVFSLKLYVGHWVKKFEQMGGIQAIFFYFYTLGNFFPMFKPLLKPILANAESVFEGKAAIRPSLSQILNAFWNWL